MLLRSLLILFLLLQTGCTVGYLIEASYHQQKILRARVPVKDVLKSSEYTPEIKQKIQLAQKAKEFAETKIKLNKTKNYNSYVALDRPYVSWLVRVSDAYELKPHEWWFPIVGSISYKGYASKEKAENEAATFDPKKYDTHVRGVSAYSTLGWFEDPILSPMIRYKDHALVNLIIHESTHATLYIKNNTDFNERLATFIGDLGTRLYYQELEGENSETIKLIEKENRDRNLFSKFISKEIEDLKTWYSENKGKVTAEGKTKRLAAIQKRFKFDLMPILKTKNYDYFTEVRLNNAKLLPYQTYVQDLSDFQKLYEKSDKDFAKFLEQCRKLEDSDDADAVLKKMVM